MSKYIYVAYAISQKISQYVLLNEEQKSKDIILQTMASYGNTVSKEIDKKSCFLDDIALKSNFSNILVYSSLNEHGCAGIILDNLLGEIETKSNNELS